MTRRPSRLVVPTLLAVLLVGAAVVPATGATTPPATTTAGPEPLLPRTEGWIQPNQEGFVAYLGQRKSLHDVWVYPAFGRTVQLQRLERDGSWTDVASYTTDTDTVYGVVRPRLPQVDVAGPAKYRLLAPATAWDAEVASPVIAVDHQDPEEHRVVREAASAAIEPWCPGASLAIGMPMAPDMMGVTWTWTGEIGVAGGLTKDEMVATALHECAHVLQADLPVDPAELEDTLVRIYGPLTGWDEPTLAPGTEQNADCVAELMGSPVPGPYTTRCDGARRAAAEDVLAGRVP